uniref:Uncharacterized protein TCIL3000_11_7190 n=1 Tax=Trypanosoma congolense (strain IL3000) TaxID=1068625 RepID=G0V0W8_TRYCI|nr:unnamed protein product [Trypanosoma congolense IL3000]
MNGGVTYVPMSPGHQSMGTMMCESFGTVAQSQTTATVHSPLTYIPVSMPMSGTLGGGVASPCTPVTGLFSSDLAVKRSPPSYESYRPTQTKRQCAPTRQRSGTNVHGSLQGVCSYYSYNISAALKQYEQMGDVAENPDEQLLPVFFQMFPCELRSRTIVVLNRVVQATCGPDVAVVVSIESRSETSFVALVHTRNVWLLIHRLRCRVLMDRHGFWHAEDFSQYLRLKEYCEGVRRLPQQTRHLRTDGLPCMPLVVELARGIMVPPPNPPLDPPSFDQLVPITTVERRVRGTTTGGEAEAFDKNQQGHEDVMFSH